MTSPRRFGLARRGSLAMRGGFAALLLTCAGGAQTGEGWRAATTSRAERATYAAPRGDLTAAIRCGPSRGYVEQVFTLRGPLDLVPSPHGDARMLDLTIAYRSVGSSGGLTTSQLAAVRPLEGGFELVTATTANSLPNLATGQGRPAAFDVTVGGRTFQLPFLPADLAARLHRECDFRWYDYVIGGIGLLLYRGR